MLNVWIHSPSLLLAKALGELVSVLGYKVQFEEHPPAELALWDLSCCEDSYPSAPLVPTLALLRGNEDELVLKDLLSLGYRSYLQGDDGEGALKSALEALGQEA
jgi:hypothetical protein